jgi:glycosyltransferase involved in cell wall biosynthesis
MPSSTHVRIAIQTVLQIAAKQPQPRLGPLLNRANRSSGRIAGLVSQSGERVWRPFQTIKLTLLLGGELPNNRPPGRTSAGLTDSRIFPTTSVTDSCGQSKPATPRSDQHGLERVRRARGDLPSSGAAPATPKPGLDAQRGPSVHIPARACQAVVLHVLEPVQGGVPTFARLASRHLSELGVASLVLSADPESEYTWTTSRSLIGMVHATREVRIAIQASDCAIVHAHSAFAGVVVRLAQSKKPIVYSPHAWAYWRGGCSAFWWWLIESLLARRTDGFAFVSESERQSAPARSRRVRHAVVGVPVDQRFLNARGLSRMEARKRLKVDLSKRPLIVCVARIAKQKGQDRLAHLTEDIERLGTCLHLVGPVESRSVNRILPDSWVRHGSTSIPEAWYRAADLVVAPSRWEGLPIGVLEALTCGARVLASDIRPHVELARLLGSPKQLRIAPINCFGSAMLELLADDSDEDASDRVMALFSGPAVGSNLHRLYRAMLDES